MNDIVFDFEGTTYCAPMSFYDTGSWTMPDGRVLRAERWGETCPPQPMGLYVEQPVDKTAARQAFMSIREEEFTGLWAAFRAAGPHDYADNDASQVVSGLPIEALRDWDRPHPVERTPGEVVLRAMLAAYQDAELDVTIRCLRGEMVPCFRGRIQDIREALASHVVFGSDPARHCEMRALVTRDYEARLRGDRPLDAPPMEAA